MKPLELQLIPQQTQTSLAYQLLHINITTPDGLVEPQDLQGVSLPDGFVGSQGVVIEGRAPIWVYGFLVHACHAAAWVACFDPRLGAATSRSGGAVVVETHSRVVEVGQVLPIDLPESIFRK
uniref:CRISPR-associated ring nuclease Crn3/Csx3 n=1 Tax=Trichocoleus desertorum TaxID=1481672 RepID=UPI0025B58ADF|nr:CRISPR-associated ring nuclease Crn3/Csx3 [Trichocoleus desertorum]